MQQHEPSTVERDVGARARAGASVWLSLFETLLEDPSELGAEECRQRLQDLQALRSQAPSCLAALEKAGGPDQAEWLSTLRQAVEQLDGIEQRLRERLGFLAPGDPQASVALRRLRARLAALQARREVEEVAPGLGAGERLEMATAAPNAGGAVFLGVFSLGWLSFTTFHAIAMLSGMWRVFGLASLALLGFYAIFFLVGFGMLAGAIRSLGRERIVLDGWKLTIIREYLGLLKLRRTYTLGPDSRACRLAASVQSHGSRAMEVAVTDAGGREIRLARTATATGQQRIVKRLNEYLKAMRALGEELPERSDAG